MVDQQGRLLSSPQGRDDFAIRDQQIEFARQLEEGYAQRVEALIAPLVGAGRVRAEVSAQFDMSASEEAREQFKPESQVVRSEQVSEDRRGGAGGGGGGVPGALSNQPQGNAAQARGADGQAAANAATAAGSTQSTRNYEIDRTVAYTRQPAGRLKRLSVAVLVDNVQVKGRDGKLTEQPLNADQINRITTLVKDAVGFDAARGDSVNVINSPWRGDPRVAAGELESLPVWERPWFRDAAKMLTGLIVLLALVFTVLRPLARQLGGTLRGPEPLPAVPALPGALAAPGEGGALVAAGGAVRSTGSAYEDQIAQARALVSEDPARVAQVVKKWVATDA